MNQEPSKARRIGAALALVAAVALLVQLQLYHYQAVPGTLARVNRLTGQVQAYQEGRWVNR